MAEKALVPVQQQAVDFYGDEIMAVAIDLSGRQVIYVPIRSICEFLGLSWASQRNRINRDPVLSQELRSVFVTNTEPKRTRQIEMLCLPLDYLNGFLFGINASRVKDEIRDSLIRYQRECYRILGDAFKEGQLSLDTAFSDLLDQNTDAVQAYKMAMAVVKLARNQILIESRLDTHTAQLTSHERRLEEIESQLGDESRSISQEQASQISQAVKAIAMVWSKQTKRNQYGAVYGRLYEAFGITSYKLLPTNRFQDAMNWLTSWYQELTDGGDVPF